VNKSAATAGSIGPTRAWRPSSTSLDSESWNVISRAKATESSGSQSRRFAGVLVGAMVGSEYSSLSRAPFRPARRSASQALTPSA
jgi:hypothetical protein